MKTLTVVTVTYNADKDLERTIQSVIAQTYFSHIEYIIIDGNSKDATVEIIKKYESYLSHWVSEPDKGIYDAMNKGIGIAKSEWINFMNAGDIFTTNTTVADILGEDIAPFDIVYGNYVVVYQTFKSNIYTPKDLSAFYSGMPVNHQSIFMKTEVARLHLYDLAYKIACDYEQLLYFYSSGKKFHHVDKFIAAFGYGGLSTTRKLLYLDEQMAILEKYKPDAALAVFQRKIFKEKILNTLRKLLPMAIFEKLIQFKNILAKK
jgi:glycosyltransferase involved in cell wall biosynthesis